jgi:hypothetical protein
VTGEEGERALDEPVTVGARSSSWSSEKAIREWSSTIEWTNSRPTRMRFSAAERRRSPVTA